MVLADLLQEAARRSQILVTTHSPDLIDRLPVENLRVVNSERGIIADIEESLEDIEAGHLISLDDVREELGLTKRLTF